MRRKNYGRSRNNSRIEERKGTAYDVLKTGKSLIDQSNQMTGRAMPFSQKRSVRRTGQKMVREAGKAIRDDLRDSPKWARGTADVIKASSPTLGSMAATGVSYGGSAGAAKVISAANNRDPSDKPTTESSLPPLPDLDKGGQPNPDPTQQLEGGGKQSDPLNGDTLVRGAYKPHLSGNSRDEV